MEGLLCVAPVPQTGRVWGFPGKAIHLLLEQGLCWGPGGVGVAWEGEDLPCNSDRARPQRGGGRSRGSSYRRTHSGLNDREVSECMEIKGLTLGLTVLSICSCQPCTEKSVPRPALTAVSSLSEETGRVQGGCYRPNDVPSSLHLLGQTSSNWQEATQERQRAGQAERQEAK